MCCPTGEVCCGNPLNGQCCPAGTVCQGQIDWCGTSLPFTSISSPTYSSSPTKSSYTTDSSNPTYTSKNSQSTSNRNTPYTSNRNPNSPSTSNRNTPYTSNQNPTNSNRNDTIVNQTGLSPVVIAGIVIACVTVSSIITFLLMKIHSYKKFVK
ncbi:hypothetical protein Glove_12g36 [Diversispora epigaea]|uniref:Uncharacterized protein n=1 Tax=Diversispora epigaea TaxID=1348612 RepID=A0A397JZ01_9GLOM|nr:hypothetical protein Glove_12g36 [Diversispora epigaea]